RVAEHSEQAPSMAPRAAARRAVAWQLDDSGNLTGWQAPPQRRETAAPLAEDPEHSVMAYKRRAGLERERLAAERRVTPHTDPVTVADMAPPTEDPDLHTGEGRRRQLGAAEVSGHGAA